MNKYLIYCFLIIATIYGCDDLSGHGGASKSITDSKDKGVYVSEYRSITNPVVINDTLKVHVKNVWLEKQWKYDDDLKPKVSEGYQMILKSDKEDLKGFTVYWTIGIDFNKYWRFCSANNIMTDFKDLPRDTIIWEVQKGYYLDSLSKKEVIGKFMLVKK